MAKFTWVCLFMQLATFRAIRNFRSDDSMTKVAHMSETTAAVLRHDLNKNNFNQDCCTSDQSDAFFELVGPVNDDHPEEMEEYQTEFNRCELEQESLNIHFSDVEIIQEGFETLAEKTCHIPKCIDPYNKLLSYDAVPDCIILMGKKPVNVLQLVVAIVELCNNRTDNMFRRIENSRSRMHELDDSSVTDTSEATGESPRYIRDSSTAMEIQQLMEVMKEGDQKHHRDQLHEAHSV